MLQMSIKIQLQFNFAIYVFNSPDCLILTNFISQIFY